MSGKTQSKIFAIIHVLHPRRLRTVHCSVARGPIQVHEANYSTMGLYVFGYYSLLLNDVYRLFASVALGVCK